MTHFQYSDDSECSDYQSDISSSSDIEYG